MPSACIAPGPAAAALSVHLSARCLRGSSCPHSAPLPQSAAPPPPAGPALPSLVRADVSRAVQHPLGFLSTHRRRWHPAGRPGVPNNAGGHGDGASLGAGLSARQTPHGLDGALWAGSQAAAVTGIVQVVPWDPVGEPTLRGPRDPPGRAPSVNICPESQRPCRPHSQVCRVYGEARPRPTRSFSGG